MRRASKFTSSSFCTGGGCVEVAGTTAGGIHVRASGQPHVTLIFTRDEWTAFVAGVKAGEFDFPLQRDAGD